MELTQQKMKTLQHIKTYPFTEKHLQRFRKELKKAGNFDELMLKKKALKRYLGMKYICLIKDIEGYKHKHLKGIYKSLHPMYDTEMPYIFWSSLYEILLESEAKNI
jgi:hypothetical protein